MLTTLNKGPRSERAPDVVDALIECHERIRRFSAMAVKLAQSPGEEPALVSDAASRVHRYFDVALPLHTVDEDESILPRLIERAGDTVRAALETMRAEHREIDAALDELRPRWLDIARDPARVADDLATLLARSEALFRAFERHLAAEESTILPAIRQHFTPEEHAAVRREMQARRMP